MFIDTHATTLLVSTAARLPAGRRLILHHPPRLLQRIIGTLWPSAPGLEMDLQ